MWWEHQTGKYFQHNDVSQIQYLLWIKLCFISVTNTHIRSFQDFQNDHILLSQHPLDTGLYFIIATRLPTVQYLRRRKSALAVTVSLLALALVVLTIGLISATRTDNVPVAGFYPGITVSCSFTFTQFLLSFFFICFFCPLNSFTSCASSWVLEHFWVLLVSTW